MHLQVRNQEVAQEQTKALHSSSTEAQLGLGVKFAFSFMHQPR